MEVKIKSNEELIDATVEMVDGVMVVSPKEVKFEPKDGDVCTHKDMIYIFKGVRPSSQLPGKLVIVYHCYSDCEHFYGKEDVGVGYIDSEQRYATEEEKKQLFAKMKEKGYEWDAEKKEVVKIKWKPEEWEAVYVPMFIIENGFGFYFEPQKQTMRHELQMYLDKDMCFKTKEECKSFCSALNQAINSVQL